MRLLRTLLLAFTALLLALTCAAIANEGANLVPHFIAPVFALTWQGQFNVDFAGYLILSGLWVAWRNGFTMGGTALGLVAASLGMLFFAPYLIYLIGRSGGDPVTLLLGIHSRVTPAQGG